MSDNPHARDEEKQQEFIDRTIAKFKFISLGAGNMFSQVERLDSAAASAFDKSIQMFLDSEQALEGKLLVVDEVHNLANSIANGSKNGIQLYDLIMKTKDIRLIFLTATPMINSPFELVPIFNMLRGKLAGGHTLLPESYTSFAGMFIDRAAKDVKNRQKLMNRLFGLISYYGPEYFHKDNKDFPEQLPTKVEKVAMSEYQFAQYETMRVIERKEEERKQSSAPAKADRFADKNASSSSYRVRSRQTSNFAFPPGAFSNVNGRITKSIEKITEEDMQQLEIYSPKINRLIENLEGPGPDVIYSQFIPTVLCMALESRGFAEYAPGSRAKRSYAVISGEVRPEDRAAIVAAWNNPENIRGATIKVLFITATGAEGLDLKYGRRVHIFEPFWNMARVEQVIARIVRYKSHVALPPEERNVQPFVYLSVYPADYPAKNIKEPTTDEDIYATAVANKQLINSFTKLLIEASVDCTALITEEARQRYKCMMCAPTNMPLFYPDISVDMETPNRCVAPEQKKIQAQEIILPDIEEKFYYTRDAATDDVRIFYFSEKVNGYIPLPKTHRYYVDLMRQILLHDLPAAAKK